MYKHTVWEVLQPTPLCPTCPTFRKSQSQGPKPNQRASRQRLAVQVHVRPFQNFGDIIGNVGKLWDLVKSLGFWGISIFCKGKSNKRNKQPKNW